MISRVIKARAERREIFSGEITRIIHAELESMSEDDAESYDKAMDIVEKDLK